VLGGGITGRAGSPEREYSQMSPPDAAIGVPLGAIDGEAAGIDELDGREVTGLWLTGRSLTGIWPQPLISTAAPTMAVTIARRAPVFELLAHRYRSPPASSSLAEEKRLRSLLLRPAARDTEARGSFTVVLCHRLHSLPGSDKPVLSPARNHT
jgi:hypothetical protein